MPHSDDFFQRQQAAAVLKHGILARYPLVFASMTGSTSQNGRVVYFDGYAGPGRYEDGAPGSPLLAVETARRTARFGRDVDCLFVERNPRFSRDLRTTLTAEAPPGFHFQVWPGDVADHVDTALSYAGADPLLTFLDPFGTALDYSVLTGKLLQRRSAPTEVLLNINIESVRRIGGLLGTGRPALTDAEQRTLGRVDRFLGDDWWRAEFRQNLSEQGSAAAAATKVAGEFKRRVRAATGCASFSVPVARRPDHEPLFLMVLFTRYRYASWKFNEAVSHANREWRRTCWRQDLTFDEQSEPDLFGSALTQQLRETVSEQRWIDQQHALEQGWVATIAGNLRQLLGTHGSARLGDHLREVYGSTLGLARDTHVNQAWKRLVALGEASPKAPNTPSLHRAVISACDRRQRLEPGQRHQAGRQALAESG